MQFFRYDKRYYGTRIAQSLNSYVAKHVVRFLHLFKFGLVVFSEFISEGIGGSRETPAYCFFILNPEKTTDDSCGVAELSASSVMFGTLRCNI